MNKQELIKAIKNEPYEKGIFVDTIKFNRNWLLRKIEKLDEPQKVVVPQFVADFISEQKKQGYTLSYSIDACMSDRVAEWYWDNSELFARAWLDGYEIEKEKRYRVKLKSNSEEIDYLVNTERNGLRFYSTIYTQRREHTLKELEEAGFGWVFDCEGVEIEEVED